MIIRVGYERNAQEWWAAFWLAVAEAGFRERNPALYKALRELVCLDSVEASEPLASDLARWAASLPGWGEEGAPHPLTFVDEGA